MPLAPRERRSQNSAEVWPRAQTTPRPVTATRFIPGLSSAHFLLDKLPDALDRILHASHVLHSVIRNADVELGLQGEHDVDAIERIDFQILERLFLVHRLHRDLLRVRNHPNHTSLKVICLDVCCHLPPRIESSIITTAFHNCRIPEILPLVQYPQD